jgi:predicted DNA binding CopG/RHH family protein
MKKIKNLRDIPIKKEIVDEIVSLDTSDFNPLKKITICINKRDIKFFKEQANVHHIPYQKIIQAVLYNYVDKYKERNIA